LNGGEAAEEAPGQPSVIGEYDTMRLEDHSACIAGRPGRDNE